MNISASDNAIPPLPEHWVNVQSLRWTHLSPESYLGLGDHISSAVYRGQLHKIEVDTKALICAIPAMVINGLVVLLQLNFHQGSEGGWDLASITLDDNKGSTTLTAPSLTTPNQTFSS